MEGIHPLKAFRERQVPPLSQGDLAGLLDVARETVARWELCHRKIGQKNLPIVAEKTGIPAHVLRPDLAELVRR